MSTNIITPIQLQAGLYIMAEQFDGFFITDRNTERFLIILVKPVKENRRQCLIGTAEYSGYECFRIKYNDTQKT